ncbi:DUF2092 domain-containing protein [Paraburkholderia phytofirmans]|uniref:Putative periplasmic protein n=1 Tax=Paraburkholderia phytofirmans (strain DSM 17436 / LMG 22146 / PsJN) TaxID=398527 RepID=B2T967_PARPJ|nr:DUF2092 domain-containing protein [Paraburkholderia phytofirmans]ACD20969.1 putative periplasmic protein [Paraburkholderia phytofirmans PsJN]
MKRHILAAAVFAGSIATVPLYAQETLPASAVAATAAVDPAAVSALRDMGAHLQALQRFTVSTELTGERVLEDGQKLQHTATAVLDVDRPNRVRVVMRSARGTREIFYDGKTVWLYTPAQKYYSSVPFDSNLAELVDHLRARFAVEIPLADLFVWGTPDAPADQFESAMYAGQDYVGTDVCNHYAFRENDVDWQIWIKADGNPLPRKLVITRRDDDARPQSTSIIDWVTSPTFRTSVFVFRPPVGARQVELVPASAKKE